MKTSRSGHIKECGECTLCCYFMGIPIMDSPEYEYCRHCIPNEGCGIWEDRPEVCRDTDCTWKIQKQIPESFRPDKIGVMFELPSASLVYVAHVDPNRPNAWKEEPAQVFIRKILDAGHSVVVCSKDRKTLHYALKEGDTLENVKQELLKSVEFHKAHGMM